MNTPTKPEPRSASPAPVDIILSYSRAPIRVRVYSNEAWFAATDIYAAVHRQVDRRFLATFAPEHLWLDTFPSSTGPVRLTAVSPLGVATIAKELPLPVNRMLDGWIRRQANNLAEEYGIPRLGLTLVADGTLPVKPKVSHDGYQAWSDLQRSNPTLFKRARDLFDPALFDDDPSLPPHDPAAAGAAYQALMERIEQAAVEQPRPPFAKGWAHSPATPSPMQPRTEHCT